MTQAGKARPKVVYVMGAGRSGSTILGVVLGNCADVFYAGELDAWLRRGGNPNFGGEERKRFWAQIQDRMNGEAHHLGEEPWQCIEHSSSLFRWRSWRVRRRLRPIYRKIVEDLYLTLMDTTGSPHIVDTSHYPLRARELQKLPGIDLYLVYLNRAPQDVVQSFARSDVPQPSKSLLATNLYLYITHLLSVLVFLRQRPERRIMLHYEDFQADPERVLKVLLESASLAPTVPDLNALDTGIAFQGNRLLNAKSVTFRRKKEPPARGRTITAMLQAPWRLVLPRLRPVAQTPASPTGALRREDAP